MILTDDDILYLDNVFPQIEGFCAIDSAAFTLMIFNWASEFAKENAMEGFSAAAALEIGVWKGKYLSTLYQATKRANERVVGVDIFTWGPTPEEVHNNIITHFGDSDRLRLVSSNTKGLTSGAYIEFSEGARYNLISIDGEHSSDAVFADLGNAETVAAEFAIVAVDDFLYPHATAVTDGVYRYFASGRSELAPFCYCTNKLFLVNRKFYPAAYAAAGRFPQIADWLFSSKRHNESPDWRGQQRVLDTPIWSLSYWG